MNLPRTDAKPWYREPWPWILMAGPAIVVVAGFITAWLAIRSNDGLVAEDYYKQGLAVNQVLKRERRAAEMGLQADIMRSGNQLRVLLRSTDPAAPPGRLSFKVMHPTQAGKDQTVVLTPDGQGFFSGALAHEIIGGWTVTLEDDTGAWRLQGKWQANSQEPQRLVALPATTDHSSPEKK